jgi:sulfite exporter TauE/SafE
MDREAKLLELQRLREQVRRLEAELAADALAGWPPRSYYATYHVLAGQGLIELGILPWSHRPAGGCLGPGMFGALLRATRLRSVFLGGVINGLLPCGLVYAYLALAASAGDVLRGGATMLCFGLGTLPLMVATGCGGSLLSLGRRRQLLHLAAWCVLLTGALTVARGVHFWQLAEPAPACPMCRE